MKGQTIPKHIKNAVVKDRQNGMLLKQIACKYGISKTAASEIYRKAIPARPRAVSNKLFSLVGGGISET